MVSNKYPIAINVSVNRCNDDIRNVIIYFSNYRHNKRKDKER